MKYRGFSVGKYNVPDMFAFIKSYNNLYTCDGICMDRDYWTRPFYITVLNQESWESERNNKYEDCLKTATAWNYDEDKKNSYCEYALPENNVNLTMAQI